MRDTLTGWILTVVLLVFLFKGDPNVFTTLQYWIITNLR